MNEHLRFNHVFSLVTIVESKPPPDHLLRKFFSLVDSSELYRLCCSDHQSFNLHSPRDLYLSRKEPKEYSGNSERKHSISSRRGR